jgi:hypothetical protein
MDLAIKVADRMLKATPNNVPLQIERKLLDARRAAQARNYEQIARVATEIEPIAGKQPTFAEAVAEVRYYQAEGAAGSLSLDLQTTSTAATDLDKRAEAYRSAAVAYGKVCDAGASSYCAPSLYRARRLGELLVDAMKRNGSPAALAVAKKTDALVKATDKKLREVMVKNVADPSNLREIVPPFAWGYYEKPRFVLQLPDASAEETKAAKAAKEPKAAPKKSKDNVSEEEPS